MLFLLIVIAYLLGSIPFALVVGKLFFNADIRQHGSGNLGATNSARVLGKKAGVIVMLGDVGKGILAASLPFLFQLDIDPLYIGFAAILGHCFPIFAGFKGGKAVATTGGVLLVVNPLLFLVAVVAFFGMILITKYVAAGSISIAPALTIASLLSGNITYSVIFTVFALFMIYLHRSNIKNFINGVEPKVNDKNLEKDRIKPTHN